VVWSFSDKVALVTGAASGIGLATAKAFAEAGAAVSLADLQEDAARSAAEQLVAGGQRPIAVRCNIADEADVAAMVARPSPHSGPSIVIGHALTVDGGYTAR
jgi:NAD(P)-dependent dehydrogenase (short-subunit alcohol dehydrogenase family)